VAVTSPHHPDPGLFEHGGEGLALGEAAGHPVEDVYVVGHLVGHRPGQEGWGYVDWEVDDPINILGSGVVADLDAGERDPELLGYPSG
jgi:hypothetical protein